MQETFAQEYALNPPLTAPVRVAMLKKKKQLSTMRKKGIFYEKVALQEGKTVRYLAVNRHLHWQCPSTLALLSPGCSRRGCWRLLDLGTAVVSARDAPAPPSTHNLQSPSATSMGQASPHFHLTVNHPSGRDLWEKLRGSQPERLRYEVPRCK